jgi:DGQHR domain-containing protein
MMSQLASTGLALPALRGKQGSRVMYLVLPENNVLNTFFTTEMEPQEDRSQRQLDPKHAREIGEYIVGNQDEYALGAITYAVDKPGEFEEVIANSGVGILRLPLNARLRSVDGQHRRHGIKQAIDVCEVIGAHHTALLIYVEEDLKKRRQMFSDMNNTPRKVSRAVNVAFNSRDPFARVANQLVVDHPLLEGHIEVEAARVLSGSPHYYTLSAVHDALKRLFVGSTGRVKDTSKYNDANIHQTGTAFFDMLAASRPEFAEAKDPHALDGLRGSTLLFSSTTLRVIAGSVYAVAGPGASAPDLGQLTKAFSTISFSPSSKLWVDCGFVSPGKSTPNARTQEVVAATEALTNALRRDGAKTGRTTK